MKIKNDFEWNSIEKDSGIINILPLFVAYWHNDKFDHFINIDYGWLISSGTLKIVFRENIEES